MNNEKSIESDRAYIQKCRKACVEMNGFPGTGMTIRICDIAIKYIDAMITRCEVGGKEAVEPNLLDAAKLALEKCPFPVGAMKAKKALIEAIARAEGKTIDEVEVI